MHFTFHMQVKMSVFVFQHTTEFWWTQSLLLWFARSSDLKKYFIVYIYHIMIIQSFVSEHFFWFHILVTVNSAVMIIQACEPLT